MNQVNEDYIQYVDYYNSLIRVSNDSNIVGSWGGVSQDNRYEELIIRDVFKGASVLEIGCGLGGFLQYMLDTDVGFDDYCGIDILPEMQHRNEKKYPQYHFLTKNIIDYPLDNKFDIVVLCGVFHLKTDNGNEYMRRLLESAWECCDRMLSFNFISSYVNYMEDEIMYHNPIGVFQYCIEKLNTKVVINHHYWKCDTSIKVFR